MKDALYGFGCVVLGLAFCVLMVYIFISAVCGEVLPLSAFLP